MPEVVADTMVMGEVVAGIRWCRLRSTTG